MNKYLFYGWETATIKDGNGLTPRDYYDILSDIWCSETCTPKMRPDWTENNKTLGQCSITAFLLQETYGGKVMGIKTESGNYHCFNDAKGVIFDLTSEQFGSRTLDYSGGIELEREDVFTAEEKIERYRYLKEKLLAAVTKLTDKI